jgi:hypothetical protein
LSAGIIFAAPKMQVISYMLPVHYHSMKDLALGAITQFWGLLKLKGHTEMNMRVKTPLKLSGPGGAKKRISLFCSYHV